MVDTIPLHSYYALVITHSQIVSIFFKSKHFDNFSSFSEKDFLFLIKYAMYLSHLINSSLFLN